jgi:hypothetical protein
VISAVGGDLAIAAHPNRRGLTWHEPLARFWAAALGYQTEPPPLGSTPGTTTGATSGCPRRSWAWATTGSQTRTALDHYGVAMRDPEGNEFDIA